MVAVCNRAAGRPLYFHAVVTSFSLRPPYVIGGHYILPCDFFLLLSIYLSFFSSPCGQTAGCIKMSLGMDEGLSPGDFVLDGDPVPLPKKGAEPPIFDPCLLWSNGWMDQDATWHEGRPKPRGLCVRWGPSPPPFQKRRQSPQFSAHVYCGQTAGRIKMALGMEVGLCPVHIVLDGDTAPLPKRGWGKAPGGQSPPHFRPIFIVAKRLDASRCHLVWR